MQNHKHTAEMEAGERFQSGENWIKLLSALDEKRIATAESSLKIMLGRESTNKELQVERMTTCGRGLGCNQFVFRSPLN